MPIDHNPSIYDAADKFNSEVGEDLQEQLAKLGGGWLGAARSWIQHNALNGNDVTWGSGDVLKGDIRVRMIEELAVRVAAAALREFVMCRGRVVRTGRVEIVPLPPLVRGLEEER